MNFRRFLCLSLMSLGCVATAMADGIRSDIENTFEYRTGLDLSLKLMKGLKFEVAPDLRFADGGLDRFVLNTGLSYKTFDCLYWGVTYRLDVNRVEGGDGTYTSLGVYKTHHTESYNRFAFDVTYKDGYGRFTPSLRLRYSNYVDEQVEGKSFLRYRAKVDYDIRKCRFTPFVSVEGYHQTSDMVLYKVRYSTGVDFKTSRNGSLSLDYKLDYFNLKYKNSHIVSTGYKYKF